MKKYALKSLGSGGVAFTLMNLIYGNGATLGGYEVPPEILTQIVPILIAIFFPLVQDTWFGKLISLFDPTIGKLNLLNQLELKCTHCPESLDAIQKLRRKALDEKITSA